MVIQQQMGDDSFKCWCDLIDVTSLCRPNPAWRHTDTAGHEHAWYIGGAIATEYHPTERYELPTLVLIHDPPYYNEEGDEISQSHYECRFCGEHVNPGTAADTHTQYAPGLKHYQINGVSVSPEEFEKRWKDAREKLSGA
uniref:Uncharacterized protein n=1 Tax=viral metagenome TaxID=1070528 RepID=A0A6M3J782_9ZZZZ